MILFLQFTITDTRYFSAYKYDILTKPNWPSPRPFNEFVRNTGKIVERGKGGQSSWVGENYICKVNRGITFARGTLPCGATISNLSKHLYATEKYLLAKYEFVFNLKISQANLKVDQNLLKQLINEVLASNVKIQVDGKSIDVPISQIQNLLKEFHFNNVTVKSQADRKAGFEHLTVCTPQLYFYLDQNEIPKRLDKNYKQIANIYNIAKLYGAWYDHKNNPFRVWIHHRISKSQRVTENRELRMTIMRMHSEYECLKNLVNGLTSGLITSEAMTPESDQLQKYFNFAIRTFLQEEKNIEFKLRNTGFFNYFSKIFAQSAPGELEILKHNIEHFRTNIKNKIVNYITEIKFVSNKTFHNNNSTIFGQGDDNIVQHNQVNQSIGQIAGTIDFETLINELSEILPEVQKKARSTEEIQSVLALSKAKDAAEKKDEGGVLQALRGIGKFAEDVLTKFTAGVLVELLKAHTQFFK